MSYPIVVSNFEELGDSPRYHGGWKNSSYAVRKFKCGWGDLAALTYATMGMWSGAALIIPPSPFPGNPNLIATEFDVEPWQGTAPLPLSSSNLLNYTNSYNYAQLTIKYTMDWVSSGAPAKPTGTTLDFSSEVSGEMMTVPGSYLFLDNSATTQVEADVNASIPIGHEDFELTWGRCPSPNWDRINSMKDTVNTNSFLNIPAGCLLFKGAKRHRVFQIGQTELWTIGLQFKARSIEWNKFYRQRQLMTDPWQYIYNADGSKVFGSQDHSQLVQF
jgi:hypothetical protein